MIINYLHIPTLYLNIFRHLGLNIFYLPANTLCAENSLLRSIFLYTIVLKNITVVYDDITN